MAWLLSLALATGAGGTLSKHAVLKRAIDIDALCSGADFENVTVAPYYRGIQIVHVPYGMNRDPMPTPRRLFLLPNGRVVRELAEALRRRKITAKDSASAREIATLLAEQEEYYAGGGSVVADREALARLPDGWREKAALPEVIDLADGFRAVLYLYRPAMGNRFFQQGAAFVRYEVEIRGFTYELRKQEIAAVVPRE